MKSISPLPDSSPRAWLKERIAAVRFRIALTIAIGVLNGGLIIAQAFIVAAVVHGAFMQGRPLEEMMPLFVLFSAVIVGRAAAAWGRERAAFAAGERVRGRVRREILDHIAALGPVGESHRSTGSLASTAIEQVEALQNYFAQYLPQLFLAGLVPAMIAAAVLPVSWAAGVILLVTAPLIPLFMVLVGMGAESISQRHFEALARMSGHFLDILQGLATLKIFDRSRDEADNVAQVSAEFRRKTMAVLRVAFLSSAVLEFFSAIAIAIVAVYLGLGYLGYHHFGSYGTPLIFQQGFFILLLAPEFYAPFKELGTYYHARAGALGAAEEILKFLSLDDGHPPTGVVRFDEIDTRQLDIEFENVGVDFKRGGKALDGISFRIRPGRKVAVVGPSGSGKSTLIHLLLGFLRPTSGEIRINGRRLSEFELEHWRRQLAWMGQNPILFPGSIAENIELAQPGAGPAAVRRAASAAGVMRFCSQLPHGIDTVLGEQGVGLSKGQIQRVALARAYLKESPLLLLDEPTAGLDEETEKLLIARMASLFKGRTLLMVTHSQRVLAGMDQVLCLDQGRISGKRSYGEDA